ncbi:MAG: shikimate kinase [Croceitalea sp.]|nr:shikimate kinase [Croceitalea sp.]MBT8238222.1 shikimate kinase [Croceitalea sp.]NNC33564.1 shikimate kinase [Croceitalea sp.]NNL08472.1 shikimate kinase [Croceitalea sp.]NNM18732.1 shikimate kinase [Croceitalea sp.]
MKIVLFGYMASGKSTVGKLLAQALKMPFIDLDAEIEQQLEANIPQLFNEKGELYFRRKESEVLRSVLQRTTDLVLSTGGGTPCYGDNLDFVKKTTANSFYLNLPIAELVLRISNEKNQRPLVADLAEDDLPEFIGKHLFERNLYYNQAGHIIDCKNKTAEEIVATIVPLLI